MPKTAAQRQAEYRQRKLAAAGRRLDVVLGAEAAAALDLLEQHREQPTGVIVADALVEAAKGITTGKSAGRPR